MDHSYQYRNHAVIALSLRKLWPYFPHQLPSYIFAPYASKTPQRGVYTYHLQFFLPFFLNPTLIRLLPPPLCWNCPQGSMSAFRVAKSSGQSYNPGWLCPFPIPSFLLLKCQHSVLGLLFSNCTYNLGDLWSLVSRL